MVDGQFEAEILAAVAVRVLPGPIWLRVLVVILSFALWADIGFVSYFTSYFSEPAAFLGSIALLISIVHYAKRDTPGWRETLWVVLAGLVTIPSELVMTTS